MKRNVIIGLMMALAICGCQVKEEGELAPEGKVFTATMEVFVDDASDVDTKTSLDAGGSVLWMMGDQVSIFAGSTINEHYQVTDASDGRTSAALNRVESPGFVAGGDIDNNVAFYPYAETAELAKNGSAYVIRDIALPATQTYAQASFGNGAFPMTAVTSSTRDYNLKFKNVLGGLKLQLKGTATISSISIIGNNNEVLCGDAVVDVSTSSAPSISLTDASAKTVTLDCGNGVQLNETTATAFIIALPPMTMTGGFTVTITDTANSQMEIKTTKTQTITRSNLLSMPAVTYAGTAPAPEHQYVDLGLTSGLKWATCNVGANAPEEYGDYFAWGETEPYYESLDPLVWKEGKEEGYDWASYKLCNGSYNTQTRYCTSSAYGTIDNKTVLEPEDDAAAVNWGRTWRMPTYAEWKELINECTWTWTTQNGVYGNLATGPNGNSIFLPAAGRRFDTHLIDDASPSGWYWSSSLIPDYYPYYASGVLVSSDYVTMIGNASRTYGFSVRPVTEEGVRVSVTGITLAKPSLVLSVEKTATITATVSPSNATQKNVIWSSSDTSVATVSWQGVVTALAPGNATIIATTYDGSFTATCEVIVNDGEAVIKYLTFTSDGTTTISINNAGDNAPMIYYSTDRANWIQWDYSALTFTSSSPLYMYGDNPDGFSWSHSKYSTFNATGDQFDVQGDIMSLIDTHNDVLEIPNPFCFHQLFSRCSLLHTAPALSATTLAESCYQSMFSDCTSLATAPELSATTLSYCCYASIFSGCTSLTTAPELPATTLAPSCYYGMFCDCTSLTTAPELPATTLAGWCYQSMFSGCTSLATAPKLPALALSGDCYRSMFSGCTSLTTAPELPATTLAEKCYREMFSGCTNLTKAPELPATTLAYNCYDSMFSGCTSLTTAPELPATTLANECYLSMFSDCTSLATAPELPATTLSFCCYSGMFRGCTSITTAPTLPATTLAYYCYMNMFYGCTSLTTAPALPSTTLADSCYSGMFRGCTSITTAPTLPATTLAAYCYMDMFYGCTSLTVAPSLSATSLAVGCYYYMFHGCTNLTVAPALSATTLAEYCYYAMFGCCTSLKTAPALPATQLSEYCYYGMFWECTSLLTAPELPATTLVQSCYDAMFLYCTSLNTVKAMFTTTPGDDYTARWLDGVAATGTFIKSPDATWDVVGINGIPKGWTVVNDGEDEGYEWVDLGLPSGLKWASCNVGANAAEEYGDYFAWGETEPYYISQNPLTWKTGKSAGYDWSSYQWCNGSSTSMTKYCTSSSYGNVDNNTVLDPEDDAATVNWGGTWRMPTDAEWTELRTECTWTWTTQNGVNGRLVTGPNGNSIFLPAAGGRYYARLYGAGSLGDYWSSSLNTGNPEYAWSVDFNSDEVLRSNLNRFSGLSVRPVTE